ncbi:MULTISPECIES: LysR family transcriptional regulator [unclassified Xanthomonas]|uniref:LysR family transcriptional regulator n=1 Tax=Xanthomonas sp. LMG 8992 TaxID=1591157 RepID=UPI00136E6B00|nr:LysR family transcriptional regulator [Xanthomonas sp. LMG 8992]
MTIKIPDGDAFSLDQLRIFIAAADHGSFSAAARALGKAQSLVSHSVQRMEEQLGVTLFDRSAYRPAITVAGSALLARARRICDEVNVFQALSRDLASGAEAEVRLAVDTLFPMCDLYRALGAFRAAWPAVSPRVLMHNASAAAEKVVERQATIGLLDGTSEVYPELEVVTVATIPIITVASTHHPLAAIAKTVAAEDLKDHVQIALIDPEARSSVDTSYHSPNVWHINDLGAAYGMLLAGLGWGGMPQHMVINDLSSERLVELASETWKSDQALRIMVAKRKDTVLRPAADWLWRRLAGTAPDRPDPQAPLSPCMERVR